MRVIAWGMAAKPKSLFLRLCHYAASHFMNAKTITLLTLAALFAGCATSETSSSPVGKTMESEIHREVASAIDQRRDAYERRDVAALEKLLADEFKVSYAGQTQTKSNALSGLRTAQAEGMVIEDVKIRVDEIFPVATLRSISRQKSGGEFYTFETLSSLQFRRCSAAEEKRGYNRWLVTAATHMLVHKMPSEYWKREGSRNSTPDNAAEPLTTATAQTAVE
jgi:hypothetical protein